VRDDPDALVVRIRVHLRHVGIIEGLHDDGPEEAGHHVAVEVGARFGAMVVRGHPQVLTARCEGSVATRESTMVRRAVSARYDPRAVRIPYAVRGPFTNESIVGWDTPTT